MSNTKEWTPSVLVEHGKHGEYYWDATTQEKFQANCLAILKNRFDQGWYYYEPEEPTKPKGLLTKEEIKELQQPYKGQAIQIYNNYVRAKREYVSEKELWDELKAAIEENDGGLAWGVLYDRSDYEYERVSLEDLNNA